MCACTFVYVLAQVCVSSRACIYKREQMFMYLIEDMRLREHIYYTCVCMQIYIAVCVCVFVRLSVSVFKCVCVRMCVNLSVYA